jgi:transcription initiation factor TFIIB
MNSKLVIIILCDWFEAMIYLRIPVAQQTNQTSCTDCGGNQIIIDNISGELVCKSCGIVVSQNLLDSGPEWRAFDPVQREKLPRVGAPITWTIHDKGLSTNIGWRDQDASGKKLNPETRARLYRLRKWQRRSIVSESRNRNLSQALSEMGKIQEKLKLPRSVFESSSMLYRKALRANLIRGRTIASIVVACVYMACRQCGVVRSLEEVASTANITKKEAARNYRFLLKTLNPSVPQVNPQGYIGRISNKLGLSGETEMIAKRILNQASRMKLTGGRGPAGLAAACVYISTKITGDLKTQNAIAIEAQVTEVTIRNRYKELFRALELEVAI